MANYTCYLHDLIESGYDLGLKNYPIWDESHRSELNTKILNHYRFYEIGFETPAMFKYYLNKELDEIMPYYIELWKTTQFEYNKIYVADYTDEVTITRQDERNIQATSNQETSGESTDEGTSYGNSSMDLNANIDKNSNTKQLSADTPQSLLDIPDIDNAKYASQVDFNKTGGSEATKENQENESHTSDTRTATSASNATTSGESTDKGISTETTKRRLYGNYGAVTTQSLIEKERELIVNIDKMIIDALNNLFMMIY